MDAEIDVESDCEVRMVTERIGLVSSDKTDHEERHGARNSSGWFTKNSEHRLQVTEMDPYFGWLSGSLNGPRETQACPLCWEPITASAEASV